MMKTRKWSESEAASAILFILSFLAVVAIIVGMALGGNSIQEYTDVVAEYLSSLSGNKSTERTLVFSLIFGGIAAYLAAMFCVRKKGLILPDGEVETDESRDILVVIIASTLLLLLVHGQLEVITVCALLYISILCVADRQLIRIGTVNYFLSIYFLFAVIRFFAFCGAKFAVNKTMVAIAAFFISMLPLVFRNKRQAFFRMVMLLSVGVPFSLLIFLSNQYLYNNEFIVIKVPAAVQITVFLFIAAFVVEAGIRLVRQWNDFHDVKDVISLGTCTCIMAVNRIEGTGAIMSQDMHHPFENILNYWQIFEMGQEPFQNFNPVSGFFSIIQGAVFNLFGEGGLFAYYYATENLFYLLVVFLTVCLLKRHLGSDKVFIISLFYWTLTYNRVAFLLPVMLLLLDRKLIAAKSSWLMMWFLSSLFHGLYYPLYGAATLVAFLPLGLWQVVSYCKSGELKKELHTVAFWFKVLACFIPLLLCADSLVGLAKHMLAMSGQSLLADSIPIFGQEIPGWLMPYIPNTHPTVKLIVCYVLAIFLPVIFVWVSFAIAVSCGKISWDNGRAYLKEPKEMCIALSMAIMPVIAYTYTFTRLDIGNILARSSSILFAVAVLILIYVWNNRTAGRGRAFLVFFSVAIFAIGNTVGVAGIEGNYKLSSYYTVPEGYIYVTGNDVCTDKLGEGFIHQDQYKGIEDTKARFAALDEHERSYMGDPSWFGYYYVLGINGSGPYEISPTVKGYTAAQEAAVYARKNNSIICPSFATYQSYYFYNWLVTSGEYVWVPEELRFYPNSGTYSLEEVRERNKYCFAMGNDMDIGKTANSWGRSMETLNKIFDEVLIPYSLESQNQDITIRFEQTVDGESADFVYLEFADMDQNYVYTLYNLQNETIQGETRLGKYFMKRSYNHDMSVKLFWKDDMGGEHTLQCAMGDGKLLIPIGAGQMWLLHGHDSISIHVYQNGEEITAPKLEELRMLKLREIQWKHRL